MRGHDATPWRTAVIASHVNSWLSCFFQSPACLWSAQWVFPCGDTEDHTLHWRRKRQFPPWLQEHQAAVANLGKRLMGAFVIFNGVVRSGTKVRYSMAQHSMAPGAGCFVGLL
ncbi:hypothetical protein GOODEAATRI_011532 [Goodea atripinnis]|uniref:Secreted protein n=1 Tax=Goodea atripinnis TaxID=208336 RepID=A0ABV0N0K1_9TELE